jgi:hypothetical protein
MWLCISPYQCCISPVTAVYHHISIVYHMWLCISLYRCCISHVTAVYHHIGVVYHMWLCISPYRCCISPVTAVYHHKSVVYHLWLIYITKLVLNITCDCGLPSYQCWISPVSLYITILVWISTVTTVYHIISAVYHLICAEYDILLLFITIKICILYKTFVSGLSGFQTSPVTDMYIEISEWCMSHVRMLYTTCKCCIVP